MMSSIKFPYLKNVVSNFKNVCTKIELLEQPCKKWQKVNCEILTQLQMVYLDVLNHNLRPSLKWHFLCGRSVKKLLII